MIPVYQKSWKLFNAANGAEYPLTLKGNVP
jgi:hypothetical protein